MTNIPFPNPHDADALNDYLDALVAGKPAHPESEVESTAQEFHALASRANVHAPPQSGTFAKGQETMHTAPLAAPVSNRTKRQLANQTKGKSYGWLSAVIVAGLLLSMLGSTWINREPRNPNENLAWAPGTAEAIDNNVLTPDSAPWIADFDAADCTETSGLSDVTIDYQAMHNLEPQGYGIVGPAQADSASEVLEQYRAMRGCETLGDAWAYWTEARINEHTRVLNDQNRAELADLESHFVSVYPQQFMAITDDLIIDSEIEAEWSAREDAGVLGQPIPFDAKINPEWAVELSDGRIAFPATTMYSSADPAIQASGLPINSPASTVVMIFAMEDGRWKYDDSLALCMVNCADSIVDPAEVAWAQSPETRECVRQPLPANIEYSGDINQIAYQDRQYAPAGKPSVETSKDVATTVATWYACGFNNDVIAAGSFVTPLGEISIAQLESGGAGNPFDVSQYLRQWDTGGRTLVANTTSWNQITLLDEPVRSTWSGANWSPMINGSAPNNATVRLIQSGFNPNNAIELVDGRVAIFAVPTISIEDRGAITYEGNRMNQQLPGVILKQFGDVWLIDEPLQVTNAVMLYSEQDNWWWAEEFDAPDVPWTQPISYAECPQDEVVSVSSEQSSSGTRYSQEDYEGLTSERDYEIVGPADPEDAQAVVTSMRETLACGTRNETTQAWTARFEWENRTSEGRDSLAGIEDDRTEASATVSNWLQDDLGLTPMDMVVNQDPSELELDGTEALITQGLPNPAYAVEFADGRVGIIPSGVYYSGLPAGMNEDTLPGFAPMMSIFVYQDGEWLLDENLPVCIGDCTATPVASPVTPDGDVWGVTTDPIATPEG